MSEKASLLDAAIQTYDGNCIMAVLVFIKKTVNQSKARGRGREREREGGGGGGGEGGGEERERECVSVFDLVSAP